ncbi:MAG: YigZ family protein [Pleurocapsa sp. SU_196_0]|nr:YigZ family protein [Pleurocapsa sp. SU_196_0]
MRITLRAAAQFSQVIKNSEFLGFAAPVSSVSDALAFVAELRRQRPDATHICWTYRVGSEYRFSDDGEPGGTAGAPMYRALEASGLDGVVVAVVRYYGGINLGAGGLTRAYGGTVAELLRIAPRLEIHPRVTVTVRVPFEAMNALHRLLERFDAADREDSFDEHGLNLRCAILETQLDALQIAVRDATRGQGAVIERT